MTAKKILTPLYAVLIALMIIVVVSLAMAIGSVAAHGSTGVAVRPAKLAIHQHDSAYRAWHDAMGPGDGMPELEGEQLAELLRTLEMEDDVDLRSNRFPRLGLYVRLLEAMEDDGQKFAATAAAKKLFPALADTGKSFTALLEPELIAEHMLRGLFPLRDSLLLCDFYPQTEAIGVPLSTRVKEGEPFRLILLPYHIPVTSPHRAYPEFRADGSVRSDSLNGTSQASWMRFQRKVGTVPVYLDSMEVEYYPSVRAMPARALYSPIHAFEVQADTLESSFWIRHKAKTP